MTRSCFLTCHLTCHLHSELGWESEVWKTSKDISRSKLYPRIETLLHSSKMTAWNLTKTQRRFPTTTNRSKPQQGVDLHSGNHFTHHECSTGGVDVGIEYATKQIFSDRFFCFWMDTWIFSIFSIGNFGFVTCQLKKMVIFGQGNYK